MKKAISAFWIVVSFGLVLLLRPYFQIGVPDTHDGNNHLVRFASYKIAIKEGQFPPRWAPNLMNQYGYPVFNYNYPLSNILSVPFSIAKVPYELTFKILVILYIVVGVISLKKWLELLSPNTSGITVAVFSWLFFPFLVSTIYYRGNIGEIAAYSLIPSMLWLTEYIRRNSVSTKHIVVFTLLVTAFLLSHNLSVVFFIPLYLTYALLTYKLDWNAWRRLLRVLLIGILLSVWFWLPAIAEMHLTNITSTGLSKEYYQHFVTIHQLFFSPLQFGYSVAGQVDGLSFSLGLSAVMVVVCGLVLSGLAFLKQKKLSNFSKGLLVISLSIALLAFLQTAHSIWMWQWFTFAQVIQFPWRLSIYIGVLSAVGIYLLWRENISLIKYCILGVLLVSIVSTAQASVTALLHRDRVEYDSQSITTDILSENRPKSFNYSFEEQWQPSAQVLSGEATISPISWNGSQRKYSVSATSDVVIVEPTAYFEGWETTASGGQGQRTISYLNDDQVKGRIAYQLSPGNYEVISRFTQNTWPRLIGNAVSVGAAVLLLIVVLKKARYE